MFIRAFVQALAIPLPAATVPHDYVCRLWIWDATMIFHRRAIELASVFKVLGLPWEPEVGNCVYDAAGIVQPTSPFQERVYFLLNYDCFMRKVGGVDRFKEIMTWLPTWDDARRILQTLGVSNGDVAVELIRTDAIASDKELIVLYEMIANRLQKLSAGNSLSAATL